MIEDFVGARGKKLVQIGIVIGSWGVISALAAIMQGGGKSGVYAMIEMSLAYTAMLAIMPTFVILGAYVRSGFGEDLVEAIYLAIGSAVLGTTLALLSGSIIMAIAVNEQFLSVKFFGGAILFAAIGAIIGSLLRIIQNTLGEHIEENLPQLGNNGNRDARDAAGMQLHTISSTISRQIDERLTQIESLIQGNRFKQMLYGQKSIEYQSTESRTLKELKEALD